MGNELKLLKAVVRKFLLATRCVPFRTADLCCTQDELQGLLDRMHEASKPAKRKPAKA